VALVSMVAALADCAEAIANAAPEAASTTAASAVTDLRQVFGIRMGAGPFRPDAREGAKGCGGATFGQTPESAFLGTLALTLNRVNIVSRYRR
jgi:hypothetical protein